MAAKILTFANGKGGVGKTTSAINIGVIAAKLQKKVLIISMEPQGNVNMGFTGITQDRKIPLPNICDLLEGSLFKKEDANVYKFGREGELDIIESDTRLIDLEVKFSNSQNPNIQFFTLRDTIKRITKIHNYDFVIIDIDPNPNKLMLQGIACADEIIVPTKPSIFDVHGFNMLFESISGMNDAFGLDIKIGLVFPTMINLISTKSKQHWDSLIPNLKKHSLVQNIATWEEGIPTNTAVQNIQNEEGVPFIMKINLHNKNPNKAAKAYENLFIKYILGKENKEENNEDNNYYHFQ